MLLLIASCNSDTPDISNICDQAVSCAGQQQVVGAHDACVEVFELNRIESGKRDCGDEHDAWLVCVQTKLICIEDGTIDAPDCLDEQGCLDACLRG